ncbi:class I SAM-dependent methyltransferase [Candidatus Woesearchaeota archaeon]|nr:class I SAM-dependent methyltransferase [Candidatus Woesearchaeota archaeon]
MDFYNSIAKGYDELYGEEQKIKYRIIKENMGIKNTDILLDVGCGTCMADFNCKVVGIDPSIELLKKNNKAKTGKLKSKIMARAENLPFKGCVFDKVISVTSAHNFEDIEKGIKEINRVGKKDFAFSILKKSSKFPAVEKLIKKTFTVRKIFDGEKDLIFICTRKVFK